MTDQKPIGSGFGPATTAAEIMAGCDLTGKTAIVTGGYSGLGLVTAQALADAGASVIVLGRDMEKAQKAIKTRPGLELDEVDLFDKASIDSFAKRFLEAGRPLHLLINNAGIMAAPLTRDSRGYESQFAINHLGHFQLTAQLWPALIKANGARVINVSSSAHGIAEATFDDPNFEKHDYDPWVAYSYSKTANALFALELDKRGRKHGIRAFSVHPGAIITDLGRFVPPDHFKQFGMLDADGNPIIDPERGNKLPEQGAATTLWCAVSPQLDGKGGVYCEDCDISAPVAADVRLGSGVRPWAMDAKLASRLWGISEQMTGHTIPG